MNLPLPIGATEDNRVKQALFLEVSQYKDVLIADFNDTYYNLVIKTGFMMLYLQRKDVKAEFIIKVISKHDGSTDIILTK